MPGGRGVGLALVRLVSTQHGGSVSVTDTAVTPPPIAEHCSRCGCHTPRWWRADAAPRAVGVLVVDDDFMVADIHRRVVDRTPGFQTVAVARSGAEALDLVAEPPPT